MVNIVLVFFGASFLQCLEARRYRTCDEGCCVHEYCAYHRICYPRIHCSLGCPDGQCIGKDQPLPVPISSPEVPRSPANPSLFSYSNKNGPEKSSGIHFFYERYSYQDKPGNDKDVNSIASSPYSEENSKTQSSAPPLSEVTGGICMPYEPCRKGQFCGLGHSCTFNYNLGYNVCQYNLDIGSTLCYDNKGNPALQSLS